jgi:hypothetical protein
MTIFSQKVAAIGFEPTPRTKCSRMPIDNRCVILVSKNLFMGID